MSNIPRITLSFPKIKQISNKEYHDMLDNAIPAKDWHFEWAGDGVKPVKGKYDPDNLNHVRIKDVISVRKIP